MIQKMYAIKDDLLDFRFYSLFVNNDVAARTFKMATGNDESPYKDLSLYHIADFDTDTGMISNINIEFVCRGEKYEV